MAKARHNAANTDNAKRPRTLSERKRKNPANPSPHTVGQQTRRQQPCKETKTKRNSKTILNALVAAATLGVRRQSYSSTASAKLLELQRQGKESGALNVSVIVAQNGEQVERP